jgi:hypothetical protein
MLSRLDFADLELEAKDALLEHLDNCLNFQGLSLALLAKFSTVFSRHSSQYLSDNFRSFPPTFLAVSSQELFELTQGDHLILNVIA